MLQNSIQTIWFVSELDSNTIIFSRILFNRMSHRWPPSSVSQSVPPNPCVTQCPPRALCHKVSPPRTLVSQSAPLCLCVCVCVCVCALPWGDIDIRFISCMEMQRLSPAKNSFSAECALVFKKWPRTARAAIGLPLHLHLKGQFFSDESSRFSSSPWTASQLGCHTFKTIWQDICKCLRWHHTSRIRRQGKNWLVEAIALCARCCHRNLL